MHNKLIGLDVDGVLADFVGYLLGVHNSICEKQINTQIYKKPIQINDVKDYYLEKFIGQEAWDDLIVNLAPIEFVKQLPLYDNAKEFVSELRKIGKVVFVTAPYWKYEKWCSERFYWLQKHFDCTEKDVLFTHDKSLFGGDILIDDNPFFLQEWKKNSIKVSRPWNRFYNHPYSTDNFNEIINITKNILIL